MTRASASPIFGTALGVAGIMANGTPEQIGEWLPLCFEGDDGKINLAAFGVTEPDAGSDVSSLRSRAVYDEAHRRVDPQRHEDVHHQRRHRRRARARRCRSTPRSGRAGRPASSSRPGTPGLRMGQKFKKMGIRASHTAEVILDDCRVPGRCLLGGKDKLDERLARAREGTSARAQPAMAVFEASRPAVGAQAVGIARAAYEYALEYAKDRKQFGRAIIENQAIAFKLADMKMRTDAARLLVWRAGWMAGAGKTFEAGEGSMSKLYAGENAVWVTDQAIQILGGYGYMRDYPLERWHRDAKIFTLFEGTSEIQRLTIARAISGVRIR